MKISDEQYVQVGAAAIKWAAQMDGLVKHTDMALVGRAAVAAVAPLLLAEPQPEESGRCDARYRVATCMGDALRLFVANRLASLTAKPDPAADALRDELRRQAHKDGQLLVTGIDYAAVVAAIDKARGEAQLDALPRATVK